MLILSVRAKRGSGNRMTFFKKIIMNYQECLVCKKYPGGFKKFCNYCVCITCLKNPEIAYNLNGKYESPHQCIQCQNKRPVGILINDKVLYHQDLIKMGAKLDKNYERYIENKKLFL